MKSRYLMVYGVKLDDDDLDQIEAMSDETEFDDILDNWIIVSSEDTPAPDFYFGIIIYAAEEDNSHTVVYNRPTAKILRKARNYIDEFDLGKETGYYYLTQLNI